MRPRPGTSWGIVATLTILSAWPIARGRFSADLTDLLPEDSAAAQALRRFRASFEQSDVLILAAVRDGDAAERPSPAEWIAALRPAIERLPQARRVEGGPLESLAQFATTVLPSAGFAYLTAEQAGRVRETLTPAGLARAFARDVRLLEQSPGLETSELVRRDPLFLRELLAERGAAFGGSAAAGRPAEELALLSIAGHRPAQELEASRALVRAVDDVVARTGLPTHLRLLRTGGYAIAVEDEARIRSDLERSTAASIALVLGVFLLGYRGLKPLLLISIPLVLGVTWGYALFLAIRGGITMLTAVGAAMLVGLGVDFGVHLYAEYVRARDDGLDRAAASRAMVERAGPRVAVAALTSVGCFLAFAFTGFGGLADLGLLAALGLLACLAAYLLAFPLLVARHDPRRGRSLLARAAERLAAVPSRWPRASLAAGIALTLAAAAVLAARGPPRFVADPRLLHPESSPAFEALAELDRIARRPLVPWIVLAEGSDADELAERFARLETELQPLVEEGALFSFELPSRVLPPRRRQEEAFAMLAGLDPDPTVRALHEQAEAAGFDAAAFAELEGTLRANLARAARGEPVTLAELRELGAGSLADTFFRERDGTITAAGYLFPRGGLLPGPEQSGLVARVEAAIRTEPGVALTGFAVLAAELAERVHADFRGVTALALGVVVLLVLASSRSLSATVLALLPIGLALTWLLAAMRLLGTSFNVMNVVLLPMLVGLCVDFGVHLVFDARRSGDVGSSLRALLLPMLLSALTTVAGLGSLATVAHPAIASMGELAATGVLLGLLATLLVLPPLLRAPAAVARSAAPPR